MGYPMTKHLPYLALACAVLASCTHKIPDSAAGVGFGDYNSYQTQREGQLQGASPTGVSAPVAVQAATLSADGTAVTPVTASNATAYLPTAQEQTALAQAAAANSGIAPLQASPSNPAPQIVQGQNGISSENDFSAVSAQRDIAADAALIQQNRAQYTVIQPTELLTRPGTDTPNIVEYALKTNNPVGVQLYNRGRTSQSKYDRVCNSYASPEAAQEAFLSKNGPEKDRLGVDPDGDGFACTWSPTPFRNARGG